MKRSTAATWGLPVGQARRPLTQVRRGRARQLAAGAYALIPATALRYTPRQWWTWATTGRFFRLGYPDPENTARQSWTDLAFRDALMPTLAFRSVPMSGVTGTIIIDDMLAV